MSAADLPATVEAPTTERVSPTAVRVTFSAPVTVDEAWEVVEAHGFFGYHPAGYGGSVTFPNHAPTGTVATYRHGSSCD